MQILDSTRVASVVEGTSKTEPRDPRGAIIESNSGSLCTLPFCAFGIWGQGQMSQRMGLACGKVWCSFVIKSQVMSSEGSTRSRSGSVEWGRDLSTPGLVRS